MGESKCELKEKGDIHLPMRASPASPQPKVHPHVVVQISMLNDEDYEIDAINDLATRAVAGQGAQPYSAVLIKHRGASLDLSGIEPTLFQSIKDFFRGGRKDFQLSMAELYRAFA